MGQGEKEEKRKQVSKKENKVQQAEYAPCQMPRTYDYVRLHGKRGADGIVTFL